MPHVRPRGCGGQSLGGFGVALRHHRTQIGLASENLGVTGLAPGDQNRYTEELCCGRHNMAHHSVRLGELQQAHHD